MLFDMLSFRVSYVAKLMGCIFLLLLPATSFSGASFDNQSSSEISSSIVSSQSTLSKKVSSSENEQKKEFGNNDHTTEMDKMSARVNLLEQQINLLNLKNEHKEREKIAHLKKQQESAQKGSKRLIRSTQASNNRESFWPKLQISSRELGSMPYEDYRINIYGHSENTLKTNNEKQYLYAPISQLLHKSAEASFNNVTKHHEVTFSIQMWNEELEEKLRKYTEILIKHPVEKEKISILPIEMVKLSINHQSDAYNLKDERIDYSRRNQILRFKFICQRYDHCSRLADEMKSNPQQFDDLIMEFAVPSQAKMSQEITLRIGSLTDGSFVLKLIQRYPEAEEVFLTAEDEKRLLAESKEKIIVASVEDSANLDPKLDEHIDVLLKNALIESRGKITFYHDFNMWDSLFWIEEDYRPDKVARSLNEIYNSLDSNRSMIALSSCFKDDSGVVDQCNLSASFIEKISETNNYSKERVNRILKGAKGSIIWDGKEFVTKPIEVSKVSLEKLRNKNTFPTTKMVLSFTNEMFSTGVYIQSNYKEEDNNLVLQLKSTLQDFELKINSSIAKKIQDLTLSILHPVNDKVNQMDTSFKGNIEQTKELKYSLGSITSQVNQLRGDVNGLTANFEKLNKDVGVPISDIRTLVGVKNSELENKIIYSIRHLLWPIGSKILDNEKTGELVIQYDDRQDSVALSKLDVNAFQRIRNNTKTLTLQNFKSTELDLGFLFGFNQLTNLKFENVHHIKKTLPTLPLLPKLTSLYLVNVRGLNDPTITFPTLPTGGLKSFTFLNSGRHTDASVSRILDWILLSAAKTLETLIIDSIGITEIPSQIPSFTALKHLNFDRNWISTIKNGALRFSVPVSTLRLKYNQINLIEPGAFQGDFRDAYIPLDSNSITRFEESVFRPMLEQMVSGTGSINIYHDPIDCSTEHICHLAWLIRNGKLRQKVANGKCSNGTSFSELSENGFNHCPTTKKSK